jgi:poly(A) polymerase Pap1
MLSASAQMSQARGKFNNPHNTDIRRKILRDFLPLLKEFVQTSTLTGMGTGIANENRNLIQVYDQMLSAQGVHDLPAVQMEKIV